jgi:hypothetical protein
MSLSYLYIYVELDSNAEIYALININCIFLII